jgi:uncharacterized membrane protein YdbT with pleckstrin-like domain
MPEIEIAKSLRSIEAIGEIIFRIFGLILVYLIFEFIGKKIIGSDFQKDILLSLVVLPAIYVLKDSHKVLEAFFVSVNISDDNISVKSGILTTREDTLAFKNVENFEYVTTVVGRVFGFTTMYLYAYGSWVRVPFIKDSSQLKPWVEKRITKAIKTDS